MKSGGSSNGASLSEKKRRAEKGLVFPCFSCSIVVHAAAKGRFHPSCVEMTIEQAKKLDHFMCSDCAEENDEKKPSNGYEPNAESKAEPKRQRR